MKNEISRQLKVRAAKHLLVAPATLTTIFFLGFLVGAVHAQVNVTEFPAPDPTMHCLADDINELGDVLVNCHSVFFPISRAAYVWSTFTGTITEIPNSNNRCFHINDSVQVLCGDTSSFLWSSVDGTTPLNGRSYALNDLGEVVVYGATACDKGSSCLFIRRGDGSLVQIPAEFLLSSYGGQFLGFNNNSQVRVEQINDGAEGTWSPTQGFTALPAAPTGVDLNSLGSDLNDAGQVGGQSNFCDTLCITRGWRITPGVGWEMLTHPSGYESASSWADGIDVKGGVAASLFGTNSSGEYFDRAFYWPTPDTPIDLGDYFGMHTWAWRSNAAGLIAGGAYTTDGSSPDKAVVWNIAPPQPPTPTQQIENIEETLTSLVTNGLIDEGDASGLQAKLQGAKQAFDQNGGAPAAGNILQAASNQVKALLKSKRISQADADALQALLISAMAGL